MSNSDIFRLSEQRNETFSPVHEIRTSLYLKSRNPDAGGYFLAWFYARRSLSGGYDISVQMILRPELTAIETQAVEHWIDYQSKRLCAEGF